MNWGYKILIVYLVFVAGIVLMVFKSSMQKTDLVTTDYYAKELKYQDKIDAVHRTEGLSSQPVYEIENNKMTIHFPKDFIGKQISGDVLLYCPSDENRDIKQLFNQDNTDLDITLPSDNTGQYELQINWQSNDGMKYYYEKKVFLKGSVTIK